MKQHAIHTGKILLLIILLILPTLSGCKDHHELDNLALVMATGIDMTDEGRIRISLQLFVPQTGQAQQSAGSTPIQNQSFVTTETGETITDAFNNITRRMSRRLFRGHNTVIVISTSVARDRLGEVLDYFQRMREIRQRTLLFVTDDKVSDILAAQSVLERNSSIALMKQERKHVNLETTIRDISLMKTRPNKPITIPCIKLTEDRTDPRKKVIDTVGSAIFSKEILNGRLNVRQTFGMLMMTGAFEDNIFSFSPRDEKGAISVDVQAVHVHVRPTIHQGQWILDVDLRGRGALVENSTHLDPMKNRDYAIIEESTGHFLSSVIHSGFHKSQKLNSDVYMTYQAFDRKYPAEFQKWEKHWPDIYRTIKLRIHPHIELIHSGAITD
ncbi:Ger(x)C family spore germination protein [Sporolactobacillus sp. STSJ-5]|uniref:Ger(x)C family spore germination protein n=1 Tax=Sporolactobacillus sp. STSJ-5 TaxID=2965076 RepID=UPI0021059F38|nr:Ger(x)C family spore germination protein [Sporolactobacillus sp. STSJ-5]MCQ2009570.1 Ger(x)C family spore germination protein [Sporolactobacillus sp. STSJ-5]